MYSLYGSLVGTPYKEKDCWQIAQAFYLLVFNIPLKSYYDEVPQTRDKAEALVYSSLKDFIKVEDRKFGDLILIKLFGVESHIAVYLGEGLMLHTDQKNGCVIDRISRWEKLVVGFYRVRRNDEH